MTLNVKTIINKQIAVSTNEAEKVKQEIIKAINNDNDEIIVSFEDINMLISHFLNVSVGELYIEYKNKWEILDNIQYIGLNNDDLKLLKDRVIPNFKYNPTDREKFKKIQDKILK